MKKFFILLLVFSFGFLFISKSTINASAPVGNYLELNGGYVQANSQDPLSVPGFTFEAWIKPDSVSGIQKILSIGYKNGPILHYEVGINGGSLSFMYNNGLGGMTSMTSGQIGANQWQHIAATILPQTTKLFINGKAVFTPQISHGQLLQIGPDIVLGNSYLTSNQANNPFKGAIDEVRISVNARDVANLWNNGAYNSALPVDADTELLWHLDETRGELIAVDSGVQKSDGYLIGGDSILGDSKIHFFGVLPSPTPTPTQAPFGLRPIQWTRPVFPTLNIPNPINPNPSPTGVVTPPSTNPTPTIFDNRRFNRDNRPIFSGSIIPSCMPMPGHFCMD